LISDEWPIRMILRCNGEEEPGWGERLTAFAAWSTPDGTSTDQARDAVFRAELHRHLPMQGEQLRELVCRHAFSLKPHVRQLDLLMSAAQLRWVVTGYALTFGSLPLAGGRLADLLRRRRMLAAGLVLFALASLACGLAQWPLMLIVACIIQGAAGAVVSPAALSLLTTSNPEGPARNRALSIWQATTAAVATAGIVAGGLLTQYLGWRAVFLVNRTADRHHADADRAAPGQPVGWPASASTCPAACS
jgi:hypothetical protein